MERLSKGYEIVAKIIALLSEIPLGYRRIEIGLELRQAGFLNGILYNSEIGQKLSEKDKMDLMKIDKYLLKPILGAHSKVPSEQLHLETRTLSIPQIIAKRRMIYFQIYGYLEQQIKVTIVIYNLLEVRELLQDEGLPVGWEPLAVLGGGLLNSSLTPTPPNHVHLGWDDRLDEGAGLLGLRNTRQSDL